MNESTGESGIRELGQGAKLLSLSVDWNDLVRATGISFLTSLRLSWGEKKSGTLYNMG